MSRRDQGQIRVFSLQQEARIEDSNGSTQNEDELERLERRLEQRSLAAWIPGQNLLPILRNPGIESL